MRSMFRNADNGKNKNWRIQQNFAKRATSGGFGRISPNSPFSPSRTFLDISDNYNRDHQTMRAHFSVYLCK